MLLEPQATENIIVGVRRQNHFNWYVTKKDLWFMHLDKLKAAYAKKFEESGIPLSNLSFGEDDIERQGIPILNEKTIALLEPRIKKYMVSVDELRETLRSCITIQSTEEIYYNFLPSLYLNFDENCLYSMYTEPASFEDLIPQNWDSNYTDFLSLIEQKQKFWYDNGNAFFDFSKGDGTNE